MLLVFVCTDKISVAKIVQTPPELYCDFPGDVSGTTYQMLLQFNTSKCNTNSSGGGDGSEEEKEVEIEDGGEIERLCMTSMPISVESKQVQL
jgi:hypothetical protein